MISAIISLRTVVVGNRIAVMSIWNFLWNAVWREVGSVTRVIQSVAVTIPSVIGLAVGLAGGDWSKDVWPAWVCLTITVVAIFIAFFYGITRRAYKLEREREPKLNILYGNERIFLQKKNEQHSWRMQRAN